jgi:flagellar biosynthesis component FlhA
MRKAAERGGFVVGYLIGALAVLAFAGGLMAFMMVVLAFPLAHALLTITLIFGLIWWLLSRPEEAPELEMNTSVWNDEDIDEDLATAEPIKENL